MRHLGRYGGSIWEISDGDRSFMISIFPGFKIALRCKIALLFSVSIAFLTGCDDSPATSPAPSPAFSITLEFTRGDGGAGLDPFTVKATILLDGIPANNISPNVILSKGARVITESCVLA